MRPKTINEHINDCWRHASKIPHADCPAELLEAAKVYAKAVDFTYMVHQDIAENNQKNPTDFSESIGNYRTIRGGFNCVS